MKKLKSLTIYIALTIVIGTPAYAEINEGLIAYYPFDGNSIDIVAGNNGTEYNGVSYVNGIRNGAVSFDGVDDYIDVISDGTIINTYDNDYSFSGWIKPISKDAYVLLIGTQFGVNYAGPSIYFGDDSLGKNFRFYSGNSVRAPYLSGISLNEWYHVVGISYTNKNLKLYINGQEVASGYFNNHVNSTITYMRFGGKDNGNRYIEAMVDEIRIYNRAISLVEIQELYNQGNDFDGDGFYADVDCNDTDPSTYPGAPELCDGIDNDCDEITPDDEFDFNGNTYLDCSECDELDVLRSENIHLKALIDNLNLELAAVNDRNAVLELANETLDKSVVSGGYGLGEIQRLISLPKGQRRSSVKFTGQLAEQVQTTINMILAPPGQNVKQALSNDNKK